MAMNNRLHKCTINFRIKIASALIHEHSNPARDCSRKTLKKMDHATPRNTWEIPKIFNENIKRWYIVNHLKKL